MSSSNHAEDLPDYDEDNEQVASDAVSEPKKGSYVSRSTVSFRDFLLKPELLRAITECGFEHPSEVQHDCIPEACLGKDILCQAKSGMGKTAVFVLSTLQQLEAKKDETSVLVLTHTHELAHQISHEFERFSKYLPDVKTDVFFGGVKIENNVASIKAQNPNIVVGTPGRILDLVKRGNLNLKKVKFFILDECDRMLENTSMRSTVQETFFLTPKEKQVMMFSATFSPDSRAVAKKFMKPDHVNIAVDQESNLKLHGLVQHFIKLDEKEKNRKLTDLLDALDFNQVVIFAGSVARVDALNKLLVDSSFPSVGIHSGLTQEERTKRFTLFKEFKKRILVATDRLFGRGIDIERVNIVINYDMPTDAANMTKGSSEYLHRVGRAGRFGTKGLAISFVASESDNATLAEVKSRFNVDISELPDSIDVSTYMNA